MRIAFWGETKECGTTLNMHVLAAMMAYIYPERKVRLCRMKPSVIDQSKLQQMPENLRQQQTSDRTGETANNTVQAAKRAGRLTNAADDKELLFLDCGNRQDAKAEKLMRQADLVVVNLTQERSVLDSFFLNHIHIAEKFVFLLGNYSTFSGCDRTMIEHIYRVCPMNLGVIPYNNEFCYAYEKGKISDFLRRCPESDFKNREFFREVRLSLHILLRKQGKEADIL